MKLFKKLSTSLLLMTGIFVISSCADLSVENQNDPDRQRALSNPSDVVNLLAGSTSDTFFEITNVYGVHMNGLADQMTSTNAFFSFWDFAEEPRLRLNNRTTYPDSDVFFEPWSTFNAGVTSANSIIQKIEGDGDSIVLEDGTDVTQKLLASAYFLRGISRGYIGLIYSDGYIVSPETDLTTTPEPVSYGAMIDAAIADIDQSISIAGNTSGFTWDYLPTGDSWTQAQFITIANSLAARILAGRARTASEAQGMDWSEVLSYADKGLGGPDAADGGALKDFTATSQGPFVFYNNLADWTGFLVTGGVETGAGYLPTDLKVIKMLDHSYPTNYPAAPAILDPASSDDPRIGYYVYTENFGFLNPSRNRTIFTNYWNLRMFAGNNWGQSGLPITYITESEIEYLRAEAHLMSGNPAMASTILNASPYGTGETEFSINLPSVQLGYIDEEDQSMSGGNTISPAATTEQFQRALLREYSVEIEMISGVGSQWYFMRRHNLLQEGTALHYPIPGGELEITGQNYYTFGGAGNESEDGTASGANSWKNIAAPAGTSIDADKPYGPVINIESDLTVPTTTGGAKKGNH